MQHKKHAGTDKSHFTIDSSILEKKIKKSSPVVTLYFVVLKKASKL